MQGLDAEAYDRQYKDSELVARIWAYFKRYRQKFNGIVITTVILALLGAIVPIFTAAGVSLLDSGGETTEDAFSVFLASFDLERDQLIILLIVTVFAAGLLVFFINWIRRLLSIQLISNVVLNMRTDAFDSAARQDLSFYDEFNSGRVLSRITGDTEEFGNVVVLAVDVINQISVALILLILLARINFFLTLTLIAIAPLIILAALGFRSIARRVTRQSSRALGEVNKSIQEAVTGISVAKNFRQEGHIYHEFAEVNALSYRLNIQRGFVIANIFPVINTLSGYATAALVYFGGRAAIASVITVASWYLFVATVDRFWFPLMNAASFWSQFQQGLSAAERVFALIDSEPKVVQKDNVPLKNLKGEIKFSNVRFGYTERETVLPDFSLTISPGESIALVGHTGAGKSSIIKLVTRFYEFQSGEVTIDGVDIRSLDMDVYRPQLGIVSQVPFLFDGTVAENIRYAAPDATDEEILEWSHKIGGGEWLDSLPQGIHSQVGERGSRLSMGQRQLVALMRVLIHSPKIFILDEATASIDPFTESQIQQALDLIMQKTTAIVIAHRLSTVRNTDRIIVLSRGEIIEQGSHEALVEQNGHYAELYDTYFRHQSLDYIDQQGWRENQPEALPGD
ncbi:MAG: ABC transporter ATP-binding protein [Chloroflexota bacterium]